MYMSSFADLPGAVFDHSDGVVPLPVCPCRHIHQAALEIVHQIVYQEIRRIRYHCKQLEWRRIYKHELLYYSMYNYTNLTFCGIQVKTICAPQ